MKEIQLTQGQVTLVDDFDFEYLNQFNWIATNTGYGFCATRAKPRIGGSNQGRIYMHRLIMNLNDPKIEVDHKDHNPLNNCRSNLRIATRSQNMANKTSKKNGTSIYLGVGWHKLVNRWYARIGKDNKSIHIGYFKNETAAALAYNNAAIKYHGEFANINNIVNV
jgi:hypothetical protein